ncbi:helix-turn-helix domain-containing protein [Lentzea tibetensis]|uniref:Helix-turn-helix domain-containing protein n=1 Tax=Lentzea tibetensis TaxID=2591470 RepID=A0A563EG69_9PSEU|nr:helix-turn-helix domain-containing protein [Lentzea tibetensis]TWP45215.1 helix-turn-helix domain-containing protein [Lentzea tibetensis]
MTVLEQYTVLPPEKGDATLAHLATVLRAAHGELVGSDGTRTVLPDEVYQVLRDVVKAMSDGLAITVAPHNTLLTTQEAADMLGISRPTVVRLLEQGDIPFEMRGRHRRVQLADLLDYRERTRARRRAVLAEMTREAAEDGDYEKTDGFIRTR